MSLSEWIIQRVVRRLLAQSIPIEEHPLAQEWMKACEKLLAGITQEG